MKPDSVYHIETVQFEVIHPKHLFLDDPRDEMSLNWIDAAIFAAAALLFIRGGLTEVGTFWFHTFDLTLKFVGEVSPEIKLRIGVTCRNRLDGSEEIIWHAVPESTNALIIPLHWIFEGSRGVLFSKKLVIEYQNTNNNPRYRIVSCWRTRWTNRFEVTIPREPPSPSDSWQPPVGIEDTGR